MPQTEFTPSIDSRPTYAALVPQGSAPALMVADAAGAAALADLASADAAVMDRAHVLLVGAPAAAADRIAALGPVSVHPAPDAEAALPLLAQLLSTARMGTQLYLAGGEGLIGQVAAQALAAGMAAGAIQAEHRGPVARRMQCVHCKGFTEEVETDPFTCAHCGLTLFVRDHFSRRLGAFQGVCVDAEAPGEIPETREIRP
ncbi:dimethylamine monooxygenase subunit DmmA family protein [Poseidonocella sp. HB161398]|uniref:dimethylamine monooxygenase subunit DmmA family protein n=1 Tax=Poseidonocella sp. HB161398 TaxID=2320855 RepID=UPI0011098E51|nr:dimethylamine monooxygenase subunit DmmA family protein [Poseidonocella sp. HB161398]